MRGDLSWLERRIDTYETVAECINGFQGGYIYMNTALRVLANKGPKYNIISMPAVAIDTTNLRFYASPTSAHVQRASGPQDGVV